MKSTYAIILLVLGSVIISCRNPDKSTHALPAKTPNPLDKIVGEKQINADSIRPSNFDLILKISPKFLALESEVYEIKKLESGYYLLNQKKNVASARAYALLLKTSGKQIEAYRAIDDYNVKKAVLRKDKIYVLCDDFKQGRTHWISKGTIQVSCFDKELKPQWNYATTANPLQADKLLFRGDSLYATINVIEGCHICYSTVAISFSDNGKITSRKLIYNPVNGPDLTEKMMKTIFR